MAKSSNNTWKGRWAESFIAKQLENQGWIILDRNANFQGGELDLIANDPNGVLVFLEVKSCWNSGSGRPLSQVHRGKQAFLWRAALRWIHLHKIPDQIMRFDVCGVRWVEGKIQVEHIQNAFEGSSSTW